jgi:hypothetical protein
MKQRRPFVRARVALALVTAAALAAVSGGTARASAATSPSAAPPSAATSTRAHAAAHRTRRPKHAVVTPSRQLGMRAFVDPVTGRVSSRPLVSDEPGQATVLAPATAPATNGTNTLPMTTLSDGTNLVKLGPEQTEYEVARVGKDGKLVRACVHGEHAANDFRAAKEDR